MAENPHLPREYDAVLGAQVVSSPDAAVLGGLAAVKRRLVSPIIQQRILALSDTLKYGKAGLELAIEFLNDESEEIRQAACGVLQENPQLPGVLKALWTYRPTSLKILDRHSGYVTAIAFSQDGKHLFSGGELGKIIVWDLQQGEVIRTLKRHCTWVCSLISNLDKKTLVSGSCDHTISVWDWQTGEEVRSLIEYPQSIPEIATHTNHPARIISVAISRDGQTLVSGTQGKTITIWNLKTGRKIHNFTVKGHHNHITKIALSPDGQTLATGGGFHDRTIKIWHLQTGEEIRTLQPHPGGEVTALTFTPDGKTLVSGSNDKTVKVWNWQTGEEIHSLVGHQNWVTSLALSFDGKIIVSGSWDGTVKLWDLETGEEICTLGNYSGRYANVIASVNISPDGKTVVSGDRNGIIKVWSV
ncbi:WD40 repeat domain-containing protein [Aerosakkonema sp. BLCC-F183]|uniref:WD40 repeat domain-containing protein n=1 Tax=Aerosakkonema sp. BLCC-F183 TaxID=3342834 RepID=UPI0035B8CB48